MHFLKKYNNILLPIEDIMPEFEKALDAVVFKKNTAMSVELNNFLFAPSKRIRPALIFLFAKALGVNCCKKVLDLALAVEILHSATLIHDDIIDESAIRRGKESFFAKFGPKPAVIAGDYLLSISLELLSNLNSCEVLRIFSKNISNVLEGEINQFFTKFEFQSVKDYLKKSKNKTASLFRASIESLLVIGNIKDIKILHFADEFGTAFQIANDIKNFKHTVLAGNKSKLSLDDDYKNGIYTLPLIYYKQQNSSCDIIDLNSKDFKNAILKSQELLKKFIQKAKSRLNHIGNSKEKKSLLKLCEILEEI